MSDEPSPTPPRRQPDDDAFTIRIRRGHLWALAAVLAAAALGFLIGRESADQRPILYGLSESGTVAADGAGEQASPADEEPVDVSTEGRPGRGPADAPVTIVEFVDFECPFCGRYARETLPQLHEQFGDEVRYVSRHFPLPSHAHAQAAAEHAECAHEQDRYWQMHEHLFAHQDALDERGLARAARMAGLDRDQLESCLRDPESEDRVAKDLADGRAAGVTGTPTFFVNGRRLRGAQPLAAFEELIAEAR